ncbi:MAG: DNA polymerase/3'-5' exonuclease PolX [Candidatus Omnitrophica bacterium]|nr:DNA polymerase/3'-5' exonuclease PolX [Candidatus Omnitrophota bacterium]MCB9720778.1 DNA polymerase/3'-5' exonuclease PolX [Candidatus Omnitrophota bacterium]
MKNKEIADLLKRMGTLLEIKGENAFKIRAYYKAADNIAGLSEDIAVVSEQGRLGEIPGIGKTIAEKIGEWLATGQLKAYGKLTAEVPETLLEIVDIPTVGPKKAHLFFDKLKITTIDQLRTAATDGRLAQLPGIQQKTIDNILHGIGVVAKGMERINRGMADQLASEIVAGLRELPCVRKIDVAGSFRRGRETVGDLDLLAEATDPAEVMRVFTALPTVATVQAHGDTKSSVRTRQNVQVDLRVVDGASYGAALLYFTGSKYFNIKLRQIAKKSGMKVNEYGIFKELKNSERRLAGETEKECFEVLGLPFVPPELREEMGASELFDDDQPRRVPDLIEQRHIKGEFHVHSTYSDGKNTIAEMADKAKELGYHYLAVSDHSQALRVARGVAEADLKRKRREVDALNAQEKSFRVLMGSEVEIDTHGKLDYNERILSELDVVIAAVHSGFQQTSQQLTKRLVNACRNKHVNIIAHPLGVHFGKRDPYDVDFDEVCRAAADNNVFLEINSFPIRLDLDSSHVYAARRHGVKFVINTDAHRAEHMDYMKFGISIARRGWLGKADVLNTRTWKQVAAALKK